MKLKALSLAIAACSLVSSAYALNATDTAAIPTANQFILAGASAQDKAVLSHIVGDLCMAAGTAIPGGSLFAGSIDIFGNTSSTAAANLNGSSTPQISVATNDTSVSCNSAVAFTGIPVGSPVLFRKLSAGGSVNGITAVGGNPSNPGGISPSQKYTTISAANCPSVSTSFTNYLKTTKAASGWNCGAAQDSGLIPQVGFADVDPITLVGASPANLTNKTSFVLTFGVQVTKALRDVLQAAQFGTTGAGALRIGSDKLADMPNLSITDLASLFRSGGVSDWNLFTTTSNNTPSFGTLSAIAAQVGIPAPAFSKVEIVRRVAGSGTQAVLQSLILANPCAGDYKLNPAADNTPPSTTSGTSSNWLFQPSGAAVNEESSAANTVLALEALSANNLWAIGFNSMEISSPNTRFVKVAGAEPTVQQVAGNAYPLWAENQITINNTAAGRYLDFYTNFKAGVALSELNSEFDPHIDEVTVGIPNNCGVGEQCVGYLNPSLAADATTFTNANPTATATRALGSAVANMCRPATINRTVPGTVVVEDGSFTTP